MKSSSIETCEEVLKTVHLEALKRKASLENMPVPLFVQVFTLLLLQAGIIFLGDFWHVRGSLSVELLNRALKSLREWSQPVIMIPGNHDQVLLMM